MTLTPKRLLFLKAFRELELKRRNSGKGTNFSAKDIAQHIADRTAGDPDGWRVSAASAQTFLTDLAFMGMCDHEEGLSRSWFMTERGREATKEKTLTSAADELLAESA